MPPQWQSNDTTGVTTTNTISWRSWVIDSGTGTTSTSLTTWYEWNGNGFSATANNTGTFADYSGRPLGHNDFEEAARLKAEALAREVEARERAKDLLEAHLDESQRRDLNDRGSFNLEVLSRSGAKKRYEIANGRSRNVYELDEQGKRVTAFCAHPKVSCPDFDTMLAQKLMLEADEEEFLRVANRSAVR